MHGLLLGLFAMLLWRPPGPAEGRKGFVLVPAAYGLQSRASAGSTC